MTERRFIVDPADVRDGELTLRADEAAHARRVLRLDVGAAVTCIDGRGNVWRGKIGLYGQDDATVIDARLDDTAVDPIPRLHLAQGIVKNDQMEMIVQKATELGAASLLPLVTDRVDARFEPSRLVARYDRWQRIIREATKQCERSMFMALREPLGLVPALESAPGASVVLLERSDRQASEVFGALTGAADVTLFVGPEGGWSELERSLFGDRGVPAISLGPTILRAETAAVAALAVARLFLGERRST